MLRAIFGMVLEAAIQEFQGNCSQQKAGLVETMYASPL